MRCAAFFNAAVAFGFIGQSLALAISTPSQELGSFAADSEARNIAVRQISHPLPPPTCDAQATAMINQKQTALSAALGSPIEAMETISACGGYRQRTQYGAVYYVSGASQAYAVYGLIYEDYFTLNQQDSALGWPTQDEAAALNGGRYSRFEHGSIYYKANLGANALWGAIHNTWASDGYEGNPNLGYPIHNEEVDPTLPFGTGWMVSFENGVLYNFEDDPTVWDVNGQIRSIGYEPSSDVQNNLQDIINQRLGTIGKVEDINQFNVLDYTIDQDGIPRRRYYIRAHIDLYAPDPYGSYCDAHGDVGYTIEVRFNQQTLQAEYYFSDCKPIDSFKTACDSFGFGALTICTNSNSAQPAVPYTPVPTGSLKIEMKPMLNGDLNVYFRP